MDKHDLQFIADTLLIEKLATIEAGIRKEAGLSDIIKGSLDFIVSEVKERVQKEGLAGALLTYFTMNAARAWWPGAIVIMIADSFGFSPGAFLKKMYDALKGPIESGEQVSMEEVNSIGKRIVEEEAGPLEREAADDLLYEIRQIEKNGQLVRYAIGGPSSLFRLFDKLKGKGSRRAISRGKWTMGGLLLYFIKAVLIGAGMITGSKAITHALTKDKTEEPGGGYAATPQEKKETESKPKYTVPPLSWVPPVVTHSLTASGRGQTYFNNNGVSTIWQVPLRGPLANTIIYWAGYVYPELEKARPLIAAEPAFNIMVSNLNKYVDGNFLLVPPNFHSIKDIVDHFAGQVARKLTKREANETA
jgi:hypothetical protein